MCMGWCPLEADWGNWAEWANVVAAAIVGIAVWRVSKRTADLAEASNDINKSLAALEKQRDRALEEQKDAEELLILISLRAHLGGYASGVGAMRKYLSSEDGIKDLANSNINRTDLSRILRSVEFVLPESVRERLHYLSISDGARVLRAETAIRHWLNTIEHVGMIHGTDAAIDYCRQLAVSATSAEAEIAPLIEKCKEASRTAGLEIGP